MTRRRRRPADYVLPALALLLALGMFLTGTIAQAGSCGNAPDIVATARAAGSFATLLAAVQAAGLEGALRGDGPLTVLAPTDEAFARLPEGTLEELLLPSNRERLTAILTYHVLPGRLLAADVVSSTRLATLNGQRPRVEASRRDVHVDDARITATDIEASNGIIHVIDRVLLPNARDIVGTALDAGSFSTLAAALQAAHLVDALRGEGPFTVFAPTDEAFAKLPAGTLDELLLPENREQLARILTYHVVPAAVYRDEAGAGARIATLEGSEAEIGFRSGQLRVGQANVVRADIPATNGVIHVIDEVLLPPPVRPEHAGARAALDLIEQAIASGAPLYNRSQPAACAAVYTVAAESLVRFEGTGLDSSDRRNLRDALTRSARLASDRDRAWELRHALDAVYAALTARAESMPVSVSASR